MLSRHACFSSQRCLYITSYNLPRNVVKLRSLSASAIRTNTQSLPSSPTPPHSHLESSSNEPSNLSNLGLHLHPPPESNHEPNEKSQPEISDQEWDIRTGRGIYVLQQNLPSFFETGLITSIDKSTGSPRLAHKPVVNANFMDYHHEVESDVESIYSPNIRLSYTPPILPSLLPKTLNIEGFSLYMASSIFVRHTMNVLYSDLKVALVKVVVNTPKAKAPSLSTVDGLENKKGKRKLIREKSLVIRLNVTGVARVTGSPGEWDVEATYTFSPITGLIHQHIVNSIHPAPHQAVYDAFRLSIGKGLLNWGTNNGPRPNGAGAACKVKVMAPGREDGRGG